jgi:hypothetical protein
MDDREVAEQLLFHHEAAHVSACMLFEIPFDKVAIVRGFWGGIRGGYVQASDAISEKVDNEIIMYLAGITAEEIWLERHPGQGKVRESNGASDLAEARRLIRERDTSNYGWLQRRTFAVVRQRWEHIETVAAELGRRRTLTRAQAIRA